MRLEFFLFVILFTLLLSASDVLASLNHLLGIHCKDGVLLSASTKHGMSVMSLKDDVDNIRTVGDCLIGFSGHSVLCDHLYTTLDVQNKKCEMTLGRGLSTSEVVSYCRALITSQYRGMVMQQEQEVFGLLIAGYDDTTLDGQDVERRPVLYWINEFGDTVPVPYAAHGMLASSLLSYCDRIHTELMNDDATPLGWKSLSKDMALDKVHDAWETLQQRSNIVLNRVHTKWLTNRRALASKEMKEP